MPLTPHEIRNAALNLDPAEREALAEELLLSLSESDLATINAAWLAEAHRRDAAYQAGCMSARPMNEFLHRFSRQVRPWRGRST